MRFPPLWARAKRRIPPAGIPPAGSGAHEGETFFLGTLGAATSYDAANRLGLSSVGLPPSWDVERN